MKIKKHIIEFLGIPREGITPGDSIELWIKGQCPDSEINTKAIETLISTFSVKLIDELVKRFSDSTYWSILGIVDCEFVKDDSGENEKNYVVELKKYSSKETIRKHFWQEIEYENSIFSSQYVWQTKGVREDDFYGSVMLPIKGDKYIKIAYSVTKPQ
jgi:hypothetical protein